MSPAAAMPEPSTPLLEERIRDVFRQLPKALAGDEEAVHQMRVAGRRLRVALPLLSRKPEGARLRRALRSMRQLTRAAGGNRDLDVALALFEESVAAVTTPEPELRTLRRRLRAARARSRQRMAEALMDLEIARLRRDLRTILSRKGEGLFGVLLRLRRERDERGAELVSALDAAGDHFDPEALHRIRIRSRRLRYVAEVSDAIKGQSSEAPALFKKLQEHLGHVHDAFVLACWLGRQAAAAAQRGEAAVAAVARAQQAAFLDVSRAHHQALLQLGPAALARRAMEAMGAGRNAA